MKEREGTVTIMVTLTRQDTQKKHHFVRTGLCLLQWELINYLDPAFQRHLNGAGGGGEGIHVVRQNIFFAPYNIFYNINNFI